MTGSFLSKSITVLPQAASRTPESISLAICSLIGHSRGASTAMWLLTPNLHHECVLHGQPLHVACSCGCPLEHTLGTWEQTSTQTRDQLVLKSYGANTPPSFSEVEQKSARVCGCKSWGRVVRRSVDSLENGSALQGLKYTSTVVSVWASVTALPLGW